MPAPTLEEMVAEVNAADDADRAAEQAAINGHRDRDAAAFDGEIGQQPKRRRGPAIVNTTDANGEAVAVEVENPEQAEPGATNADGDTLVLEMQYPEFMGKKYADAFINISGRIAIDFSFPKDRELWDAVAENPEEQVGVALVAIIGDRNFHPKIDQANNVTGRSTSVALKVVRLEHVSPPLNK